MNVVEIFLLVFLFLPNVLGLCSIRDLSQYGGPCHYNKSTGITLGLYKNPTTGYLNGTGIYVNKLVKTYNGPGDQASDHGPNPGFISSVAPYQLNLERHGNVTTYNTCSDLPYGSVEEWNLAHNDGNRVDGDHYIIHVDQNATSTYVCTPMYLQRCLTTASGFTQYDLTATSQATCSGLYVLSAAMSICELEVGVQWTMTGYGITQLRGSVVSNTNTLTLVVKNAEYRHIGQFNQIPFSLPATNYNGRLVSNAFTPYYGPLYTEVTHYSTNSLTISESIVLDVALKTSKPCELYCVGNTYWFNYTCLNHTMVNKGECQGGVFTQGTNMTDSICVECQESYDVNNVCTSYSHTDCIGGVFTLGTNTSDTTCVECSNSYEVNNNCVEYSHTNVACVGSKFTPGTNTTDTACEPCPYHHRESDDGLSCVPWTMKNSSECVGGTYTNGTSTADSICYECLTGTYEIDNENKCTSWSYQSFAQCQEISRRHIFHPGSNSTDSICIECPVGPTYAFENTCRDCNGLKNHFNAENCCFGMNQLEMPYTLLIQPFRTVCQQIIDRWKIDCNQLCFV